MEKNIDVFNKLLREAFITDQHPLQLTAKQLAVVVDLADRVAAVNGDRMCDMLYCEEDWNMEYPTKPVDPARIGVIRPK